MRKILVAICMIICICMQVSAQKLEISDRRKAVKTSGNVVSVLLPTASLGLIMYNEDWQGLKQGIISGVATTGVTMALKYAVKKERPDHSNRHSFPSMHSSVAFTDAAFIQRRYGWKWGIPAYTLAAYVGWSRVYAKKHDWWDVVAGAAIGAGSSYIFTRPFAKKYQLSICPVAGDGHMGVYTSMRF